MIDNEVSHIIERIFDMKIEGYSSKAIADFLNSIGTVIPAKHKENNGDNFNTGFTVKNARWDAKMVNRVISNKVYTSVLEQGKIVKLNYKSKKEIDVSKDDWITIENAHKAIISKAIFALARLSSERKEQWREKSSSIETQILCCKEYALKENIKVLNTYTDYEYSGTNFERPGFQEMMRDIKERKINCIIIRDLSRLGREYLEMGRLIDKVFPFLGVRFILLDDKVDTVKDLDFKKFFEVTLKNIVNDMYVKDISVKIKTSKHNIARNRYFIGSVPSFGYKVVKLKEGQKLEVDENVSFIVKEIFKLSLEGESQYDVTKYLNKKGYTTAMTYYKTGRLYREEGDF